MCMCDLCVQTTCDYKNPAVRIVFWSRTVRWPSIMCKKWSILRPLLSQILCFCSLNWSIFSSLCFLCCHSYSLVDWFVPPVPCFLTHYPVYFCPLSVLICYMVWFLVPEVLLVFCIVFFNKTACPDPFLNFVLNRTMIIICIRQSVNRVWCAFWNFRTSAW